MMHRNWSVIILFLLLSVCSCRIDLINGGEARIVLATEDYTLLYNRDFNVTLSLQGEDISHSTRMVKNAAGDGAFAVFTHMKEGTWAVEISITRDGNVEAVSGTTVQVTARNEASVKSRLHEDGGILTLDWDGDAGESLPPATDIDGFQFINISARDYTGSMDFSLLSAAYITGTGFENMSSYSILYPDGSSFSTGIRNTGFWEIVSDYSSFLYLLRNRFSGTGEVRFLSGDINNNSSVRIDQIQEDPQGLSIPSNVYPSPGETVSSSSDLFTWNYPEGGGWVRNQLLVIVDEGTGTIHDKVILAPDVYSYSTPLSLVVGGSYTFLILALDSALDSDVLLEIVDSSFMDNLLTIILRNIADGDEADFVAFFHGGFNVSI